MIRILIVICSVALFSTACLKDKSTTCPYTPLNSTVPSAEQEALDTYIDTNNIVATKHPKGFYYIINNAGTGTDSAGLCSEVLVNYRGTLVTGAEFDKQQNVAFVLGGLIEGWQISLPLIKKGGEMKLYIPPTLGYGNNPRTDKDGNVIIPANSILVFDLKLHDYSASY